MLRYYNEDTFARPAVLSYLCLLFRAQQPRGTYGELPWFVDELAAFSLKTQIIQKAKMRRPGLASSREKCDTGCYVPQESAGGLTQPSAYSR